MRLRGRVSSRSSLNLCCLLVCLFVCLRPFAGMESNELNDIGTALQVFFNLGRAELSLHIEQVTDALFYVLSSGLNAPFVCTLRVLRSLGGTVLYLAASAASGHPLRRAFVNRIAPSPHALLPCSHPLFHTPHRRWSPRGRRPSPLCTACSTSLPLAPRRRNRPPLLLQTKWVLSFLSSRSCSWIELCFLPLCSRH